MAATKRNAMLIDEAREKIRTTQLINRLQDHALGKVEMSPTQVRAVEILLRKKIPDLSAQELTGKDGGAIEVEHVGARDAVERRIFGLASRTRDQGNPAKPNGSAVH